MTVRGRWEGQHSEIFVGSRLFKSSQYLSPPPHRQIFRPLAPVVSSSSLPSQSGPPGRPTMVDEIVMCDCSTDKVGSDCPSKKLCFQCGTSKTPLWRGGPAGPKSLCNACGIRSRKQRRALLQMSIASTKKENNYSKKKLKHVIDTHTGANTNECDNYNNSSSINRNGNSSDLSSSNDRLMAMWEVLKPRNVRIEELSEEQQAAVLLMALSHGFNCS